MSLFVKEWIRISCWDNEIWFIKINFSIQQEFMCVASLYHHLPCEPHSFCLLICLSVCCLFVSHTHKIIHTYAKYFDMNTDIEIWQMYLRALSSFHINIHSYNQIINEHHLQHNWKNLMDKTWWNQQVECNRKGSTAF